MIKITKQNGKVGIPLCVLVGYKIFFMNCWNGDYEKCLKSEILTSIKWLESKDCECCKHKAKEVM